MTCQSYSYVQRVTHLEQLSTRTQSIDAHLLEAIIIKLDQIPALRQAIAYPQPGPVVRVRLSLPRDLVGRFPELLRPWKRRNHKVFLEVAEFGGLEVEE